MDNINKNINITPSTDKGPGYIKRPYLKCAGCGEKTYFNATIGPGGRFSIFVVNTRGNGEDKLQMVCKCDRITVLGLEKRPTVKDN
jgi:hypothetical protein